MQRHSRTAQLAVLAAVVGFFAVGAVQGARLEHMRSVEQFYRWVVTAATFATFGETLEHEKAEGSEPMDDEFFAEIVELGEQMLPDSIPVEEADLDAEGKPRPKLVRAARQGRDMEIYRLLAGRAGQPLAEKFGEYLSSKNLISVGTQFSASEIYSKESQVEGVGLTSLFFGFRKLAANFMWLQVDKAWHAGQDFRMVPIMRTTVALDPNFIDAYLLGAWHLAYNLTAKLPDTPEPQKVFHSKYQRRLGPKEEWYFIAADFLKDGIRKNPRDYRLYFDLGYGIYESKLKDHPNAVRYLKEARRYKHDRWVPRMLYLALWRNGQYDEALEGWNDYFQRFPESTQAQRWIPINTAYLSEAKSDQAAECAAAALAAAREFRDKGQDADAAQAEQVALQMDQLSKDEWETAKAIYDSMLANNKEDSIALSRLLRRTALDYARQGRHQEAVGYLDVARNQYLEAFDEFSDLIIDLRIEGGLPLPITEQYAIERRREAAAYARPDAPKPKRFVECAYGVPEEADARSASATPDNAN